VIDHVEKCKHHLELADAFKPYQESPERAAIEVEIAKTHALLAIIERIDKMFRVGLPVENH